MSEQKGEKRDETKKQGEQGKPLQSAPNGGPGRLASSGGLDNTVDPHDSGGKPVPADPNNIAPKK